MNQKVLRNNHVPDAVPIVFGINLSWRSSVKTYNWKVSIGIGGRFVTDIANLVTPESRSAP